MNGRKDEEIEERNIDAGRGGEKQREASVGEKQEGSSEEEMLVQVVDSLKKSISKDSNNLQNRTTVNSSASLLAQSGVTPLMGENPVPFLGKSSISEEGNTVSVNRPAGKEKGGEVKDKKGDATEFPQTEMGSSSLSSEKDAGGKEQTTKSQMGNIGSDLNGVPSAKDPRQQGLEQPMALRKRSEEGLIHSMPDSPWLLGTALALAIVCILAVLGLGCHLHGPRSCPAPGSKSPFSDLSPTFQSAK